MMAASKLYMGKKKKKKTYIWAKYISFHLIINHPKSDILRQQKSLVANSIDSGV